MASNPQDWLKQARASFNDGDFAKSFELYEYFFDNALLHDEGFTGVRLSYCLAEWADLGKQYPPALLRLRQRAKMALDNLEQSREPRRFHDYAAICRYVDLPGEPIGQFLAVHENNPELAKRIVRFVWRQLVAEQRWDICAAYSGDPVARYAQSLDAFDQTLAISRRNPTPHADSLEQHVATEYVDDVARQLLVMLNTGNAAAAATIEQQAESDMRERGRPELAAQIIERVRSQG